MNRRSISLLVGGVGIFTVTTIGMRERTAEIGLLMALGAVKQQVLRLFLLEATVLSGFGLAHAIQMSIAASINLLRVVAVRSALVRAGLTTDLAGLRVIATVGVECSKMVALSADAPLLGELHNIQCKPIASGETIATGYKLSL